MAKRRIPGLALAIVENGVVTKLRGYGYANLEHDVPVTADSVFELASVTKQFTAAAIMLLVEEQKVGLDDPITQYLPPAPEGWRAMTIRHLLTHTAGLAGLGDGFRSMFAGGVRANYTTAQMLAAAMKDPISFAPGERWQYSDVGYFLLGMIIEKVSGQRYGEFLKQRFFQPLGMSASSVLDQSAILKNRVAGYTLRDGQHIHIRRTTQFELTSHFGVFTSARDLARWEIALASGKVLKPASLEQMWTPLTFSDGTHHNYGFAWFTSTNRLGRRVISHSGITGTEYSRYPDDKLAFIVLTNLGRYVSSLDINAWGLTHGVARLYIPKLTITAVNVQPDTSGMTARMHAFMKDIASGGSLDAMVPRLRSEVTPIGRKIMAQRLAQVETFTFVACEDNPKGSDERFGAVIAHICYFRMATPAEVRNYTFYLTAEGQVADFGSYTE